jgi:UDP-N-acetylmuramyl pentapeptide phosphotransferase/UDP-N-acetylglucosamine-1-phosphate transferase
VAPLTWGGAALVAAALVAAAGLLAAGAILALRPLLQRYALARPNARSSHRVPTPQGGGIAVLGAVLAVGVPAMLLLGRTDGAYGAAAVVCVGALALAVLGAWDDIRPIPALPRLAVQGLAAAAVVLLAGPEGRILPEPVPRWLEQGLAIVALVWFVNLVNFMDGIDWITVAEFVPLLAFFAVLAVLVAAFPPHLVLAICLLGALLGFAPFNKPVARLFLGDVGSLPIGLLVGWLLLGLAGTGGLAAAVLLALYPVADATLTLLRRLRRRERVWEAHRTHFYQRATDNGFSVREVSGSVFKIQVILAGLAFASLEAPPATQAALVAAGAFLVALQLRRFTLPR